VRKRFLRNQRFDRPSEEESDKESKHQLGRYAEQRFTSLHLPGQGQSDKGHSDWGTITHCSCVLLHLLNNDL
jgi:hypothetical protein